MNQCKAIACRIAGATAAALLLVALLLSAPAALAQTKQPLPPTGATTGRITGSLGEQWEIDACAGDHFTVTVASDAFTPFVSVYTDTTAAPIVEAASEDGGQAQAVVRVEENGHYTVVAAGERRSDRGAYSISSDFGDALALAGLTFDKGLPANAVVTGSVKTSAGEIWAWRGCAGDVVTATASSDQFTPYLELFDPTAEETLMESSADSDSQASISSVEIPATGVYLLIVAGEQRNDRGAYSLSLTHPASGAIGPAPALTPASTRRANPTATPQAEATCTVLANPNLNVRSGPGTTFAPIGAAPFNAQLRPLARNTDATWLEVQVLPTGPRGWVSTGARLITCPGNLTSLPPGKLPPTPRATPIPTVPPVVVPPATPTLPPVVTLPSLEPTLPPLVVLPGGGPGGGGWEGDLVSGAGIGRIGNGVITFRDRMYVRAEIRRTPGNRKIERVDFRIQDQFGDEFYTHTERTYGYCVFGGGEPICNTLDIGRGARWPDTDRLICNGDYTVFADIVLDNGDQETWNTPFVIDHPDLPRCDEENQPAALEANIVQTEPGDAYSTVYGALVFQVEAYDAARGFQDGDGIRNVDLRIFDADGREVYQRTESNAAYCAFAGGEPDCNVWRFGDSGDAWPSGEPVRYGEPYLLRAIANAEDGSRLTVEMTIFIEP
ncbi:MAG: SH3 domain-containing protein [Caldilineaceae bacterium]|nr:SH3 domain-containing protein [Caldilineaceae bacterium]